MVVKILIRKLLHTPKQDVIAFLDLHTLIIPYQALRTFLFLPKICDRYNNTKHFIHWLIKFWHFIFVTAPPQWITREKPNALLPHEQRYLHQQCWQNLLTVSWWFQSHLYFNIYLISADVLHDEVIKMVLNIISPLHTPQNNRVVERKNQSLQVMARTRLIDSCYIINYIFVSSLPNRTPYEIFINKKLSVLYLHVFSCKYYILKNANDNVGNFKSRAYEDIFLVYSTWSKAYQVFNKVT